MTGQRIIKMSSEKEIVQQHENDSVSDQRKPQTFNFFPNE